MPNLSNEELIYRQESFSAAYTVALIECVPASDRTEWIRNRLSEQYGISESTAWVALMSDRRIHTSCRVYSDGNHMIAVPPTGIRRERKKKQTSGKDLSVAFFDLAYRAALNAGIKEKDIQLWIADYMNEHYGTLDGYDATWVARMIERQKHNLYLRQRRFRQKAYLNQWNYFVTISYEDGRFDSEEDFRATLGRCLSNLHTRRGWNYMGVFEYGEENGRLHFHALVNVPDGEMVGSLTSTRRYSTKRKCWEESCENSFFRVRFGVNQFDAVRHQDIRSGKMVNYILKYLLKSGEKIVYSRGVPTDFLADLGDEEIAAELVDFVRKFVLFDDTFTLWSEPDTDTEEPEVKQTE